MTDHDHPAGELWISCAACSAEARTAEELARWHDAPLRLVRWRATYFADYEGEKRFLSFDRWLRVPDDATPAEVDEHYASVTGEAFFLALPDDVAMDRTDLAVETSDFTLPTIDRKSSIVDETHQHTDAQLFQLFPNERPNP